MAEAGKEVHDRRAGESRRTGDRRKGDTKSPTPPGGDRRTADRRRGDRRDQAQGDR